MSSTIELNPELEAQLHEEATKTGIDTSAFVVRMVEAQLRRKTRQRVPANLSSEDSILLQKINQGLPETTWQEYDNLIAKRRGEVSTPREQARLVELSESIEESNTKRIEYIAELAQRRHISLKTMMSQLGIKPRKV